MIAEMNLQTRTIKRVINSEGGLHCLPVIDNSIYPTDPDLFKDEPTYSYIINVDTWLDEVAPELKAEWAFLPTDHVEQVAVQSIKSLAQCKEEVYKILAESRWVMETAGLTYDGMIIPTDRETSILIASRPDAAISAFKIANGVWILNKTQSEVVALKLLHISFIQAAFDWEHAETAKVAVMSYNELVTYINT
jgi:hypothetical protein